MGIGKVCGQLLFDDPDRRLRLPLDAGIYDFGLPSEVEPRNGFLYLLATRNPAETSECRAGACTAKLRSETALNVGSDGSTATDSRSRQTPWQAGRGLVEDFRLKSVSR